MKRNIISKKKPAELLDDNKLFSISGRDTVVIDDTGNGSTTGASKTNTANWNSGQDSQYTSANPDFELVDYDAGYSTGNADFDFVDEELVKKNEKEKPTFSGRAINTFTGGIGRSLASDINTAANAFDVTQGARERMMNDYLQYYEHGLNRAVSDFKQLKNTGASAGELAQQQNIVNDWQKKRDAMTKAINAQPGAVMAAYKLADDVKSSADANIDYAKKGLDALGSLAVDVGAKATQMVTDAAKSGYLLNRFNVNSGAEDFVRRLPLATRIYGENTQIARQDGSDVRNATAYGMLSALTDASIEKLADGYSGLYGAGRIDEWLRKTFQQLAKSDDGKKLLGTIASGFGEFGESFLKSITDKTMKTIYNGKDSIWNASEIDVARAFNEAIIDFVNSLPSGVAREFFRK